MGCLFFFWGGVAECRWGSDWLYFSTSSTCLWSPSIKGKNAIGMFNFPLFFHLFSPLYFLIDVIVPIFKLSFFWGGGFLQEEPERPKGQERIGKSRMMEESYQLWHQTGEVCPEGTIPVRRTTEEDMMRASTIKRFGRKPPRLVRRDSSSSDHEVSLGFFLFLQKKKEK